MNTANGWSSTHTRTHQFPHRQGSDKVEFARTFKVDCLKQCSQAMPAEPDASSGYMTIPHPPPPLPHQVPPRWALGAEEPQHAPAHRPLPTRPHLVPGEIAGFGRPSHEAFVGMITGMAYGAASPLAGHPIDTVKTKLQVEAAHRTGTSWTVVHDVLRKEGLVGLYRGVVPAVIGGTIYGGVVLSVYSGTYASCGSTILAEPIPGTGGLRASVVVAGLCAGCARSVIETPLALMKVRRQTGTGWLLEQPADVPLLVRSGRQIRELYRGSSPTVYRSCLMLGTFFTLNDYLSRLYPAINASAVLGPFVKGGICASLGWIVAWPFEVVKNRIQADVAHTYDKQHVSVTLRDAT